MGNNIRTKQITKKTHNVVMETKRKRAHRERCGQDQMPQKPGSHILWTAVPAATSSLQVDTQIMQSFERVLKSTLGWKSLEFCVNPDAL